jgi:hypothetical protein
MNERKGAKPSPSSKVDDAPDSERETGRPPFDLERFAREHEAVPPSRRPTPHAGTAYHALRDSCKPMRAARAIGQVLPQIHPDNVVVAVISGDEIESLGLTGASGALVSAMNGVRTVRAVAMVKQIDLPTALLRTAFLVERGLVRVVR